MFLYSTDRHYLPVACLSIASLAETAINRPDILLLVHELTDECRSRVDRYLQDINANIHIRSVDPGPFAGVCAARGQSPAKFAPLLWHKYLKRVPERLVYIDSDTRVMTDAAELLTVGLDGNAVAAVHDSAVISDGRIGQLCRKLSIPEDAGYFNSGLLVIDTARWLQDDLGNKALVILNEQRQVLTWNDQCALNKVLGGHWKALPFAWNKLAGSAPMEWPENLVHFAGTYKPWTVGALGHLTIMDQLIGHRHMQWYSERSRKLEWPGFFTRWQQMYATGWSTSALAGEYLSGHLRKHLARRTSPHLAQFAAEHPELLTTTLCREQQLADSAVMLPSMNRIDP